MLLSQRCKHIVASVGLADLQCKIQPKFVSLSEGETFIENACFGTAKSANISCPARKNSYVRQIDGDLLPWAPEPAVSHESRVTSYELRVMSKETSISDFVAENQCPLANKVGRKFSKNKSVTVNQSAGRETFNKGAHSKKSATKFEAGKECQRKGKNVAPKSNAAAELDKGTIPVSNNVEKSVARKSSSEKLRHRNFEQETANIATNCGNILKQKKESIPKAKKKKSRKKVDEKAKNDSECNDPSLEEEARGSGKPTALGQRETFPRHISEEEINELLNAQTSLDEQYIEGYLRVNSRCYKFAYLSMSDDECDLLILGLRDRNRAFDGDFVVARVKPPESWVDSQGQKQKTGVVVCIREKIHARKAVGCFKQRDATTFFYPRDHRIPLVKISRKSLQQFKVSPSSYEDTLYLVAITDWIKPQFAVGEIEQVIGCIGDIEAESNAILLEYNLNVTPYSPEVVKELPSGDYRLSENDLKDREDWRHECVFTIDPDSAVDLDDAVSCKRLENGNYEIGVHISDVTHYLEFLSPLDILVSKRATTIYMTDNVYHMLPSQLCHLCSLTPGQDKLAFSVVWEMTADAEIVSHRFAKTVIKSCCQMAYRHAQEIIEASGKDWSDDSLSISGNFSASDLSEKVKILQDLASRMRKKRFEEGALQIQQPKWYVRIDGSTGLPESYNIEEQRDSNRLVEEFMLLANMTVATHLYAAIPDSALLRNHREPSKQSLLVTRDTLRKFGIHLNIESAASLHSSIKRYEEQLEMEKENNEIRTIMKYRMMVINNLCSKAMARATYKCSSTVNTEEELRHYGLNVSLYTHFTSPIRRYSDCVVHRLLYSAIKKEQPPEQWSKELCSSIAANCNIKKYSAKMAQERSCELYFTYLVDLKGPIVTMGIVLDVKETFIEVILCEVGMKLRIPLTQMKSFATVEYSTEYSVPTINIYWKKDAVTQVISIFTLLYLRVNKHPKSFQLIGTLLLPNQDIAL